MSNEITSRHRWGYGSSLTVGATFIRDVEPGEIVTISPELGIQSDKSMCIPKEKHARYIFEYIYFARPDSTIDNISVYDARIAAGRFLAMDSPIDADLVVGVPESGNVAALGYAMQSGIPYGQAFVKNSYIGSFPSEILAARIYDILSLKNRG